MGIISLFFGKNKTLENRAPIRSIPGYMNGSLHPKVKGNHVYLEIGRGRPVVFCHGLFGGIFNIDKVSVEIAKKYRFIMPYLPMYDMALIDCTINKLGDYLDSFIAALQLEEAVIIGSSMGGGTALYYALREQHKVKGLVLCGSSGLSNIPLSKGFFKRRNYEFVKEATKDIFYNREIPPDKMVQDVFNALQNNEILIRSIRFTKAATKTRMHKQLPDIGVPTLLVWGRQDPITPVEVAPQFLELLPNSELHVIENCGHVPTQEKPDEFLLHFFKFLNKIKY